jgi:cytoplasmic iron level regulating protein YaaA (DUF328/UPF0246 family)
MLTVISPAKNMQTPHGEYRCSRPCFGETAERISLLLREKPAWELESILQTSPEIAMHAHAAYQDFGAVPGMPAMFAYRGLQYSNLNPEKLSADAVAFAQDHLRILSALYGILRPLDAIFPYRLEMQSKLRIDGKNLYQFWGESVRNAIFSTGEVVVNLASEEYAKMISRYLRPADRWITCEFSTVKRGRRRQLPTFAKMARGQMARYLIENRIDSPEGLQGFSWGGYLYCPELSNAARYVFLREV